MMNITIQYFDSCPNWKVVAGRVTAIVEDHRLDATIHYQVIDTPEAAEEHLFAGSPTLLIEGLDPFATEEMPIGLVCRTFMTRTGLAGSPSVDEIEEALGV